MKHLIFLMFALIGTTLFFSSCDKDDDTPCTESFWYEDADGDGLGNPAVSEEACVQP